MRKKRGFIDIQNMKPRFTFIFPCPRKNYCLGREKSMGRYIIIYNCNTTYHCKIYTNFLPPATYACHLSHLVHLLNKSQDCFIYHYKI